MILDYMNTAPSSSTHSAPDTDSSGKKGKRHLELQAPAALTRNPSSNSDSIRALFGSGVERKEPPDKGISPDSGVHSAENDPGDENDVHSAQNIINLINQREREYEEKLRKDKEEEKLRREKERERGKKKERERDRPSSEKRSKDSDRRDKISERPERPEKVKVEVKVEDAERQKLTENEYKSEEQALRADGLRGEIILKGLDRSRLNHLIEIGKRTGRMKEETRKEDYERKIGKESACRVHPALNLMTLVTILKFIARRQLSVATRREAVSSVLRQNSDKVAKMIFYLDATVYFILSAKHFTSQESPEVRCNKQYSIVRDTNDLIKRVTQAFCAVSEGCSPWHMHMLSRIRNLSSRCQACLLYHMYNFRSQNAIKSYGMLMNMDSQIQEERHQSQNGASATTSSSPGSSVHSKFRISR
ncbi:hypothetical protein COOONC_03742 [Cooperia oncophora]